MSAWQRSSPSEPRGVTIAGIVLWTLLSGAGVQAAGQAQEPEEQGPREIDARAREVPHDPSVFGNDPTYEDAVYDAEQQTGSTEASTAIRRSVRCSSSAASCTLADRFVTRPRFSAPRT